MPFFNVEIPGFNLPQPQQLPSDVRNPMGTLANTLQSIAAAQQQRKQEEMQLRQQEMQMAAVRRQQEAADLKMKREQQDLQRQDAFRGDVQGLASKGLTQDQLEEQIAQAALKYGDFDTYQTVQTKLQMKRDEMEAKKMKDQANALTSFARRPKDLKIIAQANPELARKLGFSPEAIAAMPTGADGDNQEIREYYDAALGKKRPYIIGKNGKPYYLDELEAFTYEEKQKQAGKVDLKKMDIEATAARDKARAEAQLALEAKRQEGRLVLAERKPLKDVDVQAGSAWLKSMDYKKYSDAQDKFIQFDSAYKQAYTDTPSNKEDAIAQLTMLWSYIQGLDKTAVRDSERQLFLQADGIYNRAKSYVSQFGDPEQVRIASRQMFDEMYALVTKIASSADAKADERRQYYQTVYKGQIPPVAPMLPGAPGGAPASGTAQVGATASMPMTLDDIRRELAK